MRFFALAVLLASSLVAGTIISVTGPTPSTGQIGSGVNSSQMLGIGWTQTGTYTNVTISAELGLGDGTLNNGHAYLTTLLGPGTTNAAEIANAAFTMPTTETLLTVLSVPTLGPGTYWVLLTNSSPLLGTWFLTNTPTLTLDTGVTKNTGKEGGSIIGYPPGDFFTDYTGNLRFTVQGTAVTTPEPGTLALVCFGIAGILAYRARQR